MANDPIHRTKPSLQRLLWLSIRLRIGLMLLLGAAASFAMADERSPGMFRATGAKFVQLTPSKEILARIDAQTKRGAQEAEKISGAKFPADQLAELRRDAFTDWAVSEVLAAAKPEVTFSLALPAGYNLNPGPNRLRIQSSTRITVGPHDDCHQVTVALDAEGKEPKVESLPVCRVDGRWRPIQ